MPRGAEAMMEFIGPISDGSIKVIESPDRPKYELPAEVIPGVPWPPGFRDEINRWALGFFGTWNVVPTGVAYIINGDLAVIRPEHIWMLKNLAP